MAKYTSVNDQIFEDGEYILDAVGSEHGEAARIAGLLNRSERMEAAIREFIRINNRDEYEFESSDPAMWAQLNAALEEQPT